MHRITESAIEQLTIEKLEALGYQYVYGPAIAADGERQYIYIISNEFL